VDLHLHRREGPDQAALAVRPGRPDECARGLEPPLGDWVAVQGHDRGPGESGVEGHPGRQVVVAAGEDLVGEWECRETDLVEHVEFRESPLGVAGE